MKTIGMLLLVVLFGDFFGSTAFASENCKSYTVPENGTYWNAAEALLGKGNAFRWREIAKGKKPEALRAGTVFTLCKGKDEKGEHSTPSKKLEGDALPPIQLVAKSESVSHNGCNRSRDANGNCPYENEGLDPAIRGNKGPDFWKRITRKQWAINSRQLIQAGFTKAQAEEVRRKVVSGDFTAVSDSRGTVYPFMTSGTKLINKVVVALPEESSTVFEVSLSSGEKVKLRPKCGNVCGVSLVDSPKKTGRRLPPIGAYIPPITIPGEKTCSEPDTWFGGYQYRDAKNSKERGHGVFGKVRFMAPCRAKTQFGGNVQGLYGKFRSGDKNPYKGKTRLLAIGPSGRTSDSYGNTYELDVGFGRLTNTGGVDRYVSKQTENVVLADAHAAFDQRRRAGEKLIPEVTVDINYRHGFNRKHVNSWDGNKLPSNPYNNDRIEGRMDIGIIDIPVSDNIVVTPGVSLGGGKERGAKHPNFVKGGPNVKIAAFEEDVAAFYPFNIKKFSGGARQIQHAGLFSPIRLLNSIEASQVRAATKEDIGNRANGKVSSAQESSGWGSK